MTNSVSLTETEIDAGAAKLLPHEHASELLAFPFKKDASHLHVAFANAWDAGSLQSVTDIAHLPVLPYLADEGEIRHHIDRWLGRGHVETIANSYMVSDSHHEDVSGQAAAEVTSAPVVKLVDSILEAAVLNRASDIHIEPYGHHLRARLRIDGLLFEKFTVGIALLPSVVSRLKIMAGLDIAEKRQPQDGQFTHGSENMDFRLSTLPTTNGEKAVIRLMYSKKARLDIESLGFLEQDLPAIGKMFGTTSGAVFLTGPTGSGKSTTLAAYLSKMNREWRNIVTVEDPVEYPIAGVSHVNVSQKLGFKAALRHILRQDPDVILIGEVRDEETARIAVQASITGHTVLSTIHTNDAAGVVERLIDLGIPAYMVAAALSGVMSQRLVRKLCRECKKPMPLHLHEAEFLGLPAGTAAFVPSGCSMCGHSGYKGRFAIYEYFAMDEELRKSLGKDPEGFIDGNRGKRMLAKNAAARVIGGCTSAVEAIRATSHSLAL